MDLNSMKKFVFKNKNVRCIRVTKVLRELKKYVEKVRFQGNSDLKLVESLRVKTEQAAKMKRPGG